MDANGRCLCGSVALEIQLANSEVGACHCSMCRKWGGGPMLVVDSGELKKISGESHVARYQSSEWAERGFCKKCGTHLFYYLKQGEQYFFPAGLLDVERDYQFHHEIFIEEKPDFYAFANQTKKMTGAEVFAQFEQGS